MSQIAYIENIKILGSQTAKVPPQEANSKGCKAMQLGRARLRHMLYAQKTGAHRCAGGSQTQGIAKHWVQNMQ